MPAGYVEPPEPLPVEVRHDHGRWLPGYARGWHGGRVFVSYRDAAAMVSFLRCADATDVRRPALGADGATARSVT